MLRGMEFTKDNFDVFYKNVTAGIFVLDINGRFIYINPFAKEVLRITDDLLGKSWTTPFNVQSLYTLPLPGETKGITIEISGNSEASPLISLHLSPFTEDHAITGYLGTFTQITKHTDEIEEKIHLLDELLSNLPLVVFEVDGNSIINKFSGAGLTRLQLKDSEIIGKSIQEVFPEVVEDIKENPVNGLPFFITKVNSLNKADTPAYFYNVIFPHPLLKDKTVGFALDITQQKETEHKLKEVQQELERTIELLEASQQISKTGGWEYDVSTDKVFRTKQMKLLLGIDDDGTSLEKSAQLYDEKYQQEIKERMHLAVDLQQPYMIEMQPKGANRWFRSIGVPIVENGKTVKVVGAVKDITEQKEFEEELIRAKQTAEEAALAKHQFLSNMSHEIRTPLNAIIGITDLMLTDAFPPERAEQLNILKHSSEYLYNLVNDILDFNKIESGKIALESISFNLSDLLNKIKQTNELQATEKSLQLSLHIENAVPTSVIGDPMRLTQILNNLINNAIKFTEKGSVILNVKYSGNEEHKALIDFSIVDTGIGLKPQLKEHIFESFTQASSNTARIYGGTGLGLAITKQLLKLMKSDISIDSSEGKGSVFSFQLKMEISSAQEIPENMLFIAKEVIPFITGKILIVDDNRINALVVSKFIQKWGVLTKYVECGAKAIKEVQQNKYDLILMDLQMPVMDGYTATEHIRSLPGDYYKILPIIAMSASMFPEVQDKVLAIGMTDCIAKPFNSSELYLKLKKYMSV